LKKPIKHPLENFIQNLIHSETYPGSIHQCPICGGRLHFHLMLLERRSPRMAASQSWCEDCETAIAVDGIVPPPKWSEEATQVWADSKIRSKDTND